MTRDEAEHLDLVLGVEEVLACHRLAVQEEGLHHERLAIRLATDQGDASERALAEVRDARTRRLMDLRRRARRRPSRRGAA